jgi:hypothetical protein
MEQLLTGQLSLTGREDVADLYVEPEDFAAAYRRALQEAPARASVSSPDAPRVCVFIAHGGASGPLRESVASVLESHPQAEVAVADWREPQQPARRALDGLGGERVRLLGSVRGERGAVYNAALEQTDCDYFLCLEAGCRVCGDYVQRAVAALEANPELAFVSCVSDAPRGQSRRLTTGVPYGLDPVLVTVEDGAGLRHAVFRRRSMQEAGVSYNPDLYAMEFWELGWSLAEAGLAGDVLPQVGVRRDGPHEDWLGRRLAAEQYHLRQKLAELHPALIRQRPSQVLKANQPFEAGRSERSMTDRWLLENYRGLRLLRVGLMKCRREGLRALASHLVAKLRERIARYRHRRK